MDFGPGKIKFRFALTERMSYKLSMTLFIFPKVNIEGNIIYKMAVIIIILA